MIKQKARILIGTYRTWVTHTLFRCSSFVKMDFHIAFPDRPVYLRLSKRGDIADVQFNTDTTSQLSVSVSNSFTNQHDILLFGISIEGEDDHLNQYMKTAIESQKLYRAISGKLKCNVSLLMCGVNLSETKRKKVSWPFEIYRGVCAYTLKQKDGLIKSELIRLAEEHNFKTFLNITNIKEGKCVIKEIDSKEMNLLSENVYDVSDTWDKSCTNDSVKQNQSILFTYHELCPVYHGYREARDILFKCKDIQEVGELLDIANKNIPDSFKVEELQSLIKYPFVVVEGLDATGKTTLTGTLERKLEATRYYTPPPEISHLRKFFDALPEIVRRAYYCIGNCIVAIHIARECQHKAVIMDRYWHSTTAYGIANETSTADMPPRQHWVYQWPSDLLKPTLVLFLTVTEELRRQRLSDRAGEKTFEEQHLDKDMLFRQRLCEAYRRMERPACVEIDASGSKESVVKLALEELDRHGIKL